MSRGGDDGPHDGLTGFVGDAVVAHGLRDLFGFRLEPAELRRAVRVEDSSFLHFHHGFGATADDVAPGAHLLLRWVDGGQVRLSDFPKDVGVRQDDDFVGCDCHFSHGSSLFRTGINIKQNAINVKKNTPIYLCLLLAGEGGVGGVFSFSSGVISNIRKLSFQFVAFICL